MLQQHRKSPPSVSAVGETRSLAVRLLTDQARVVDSKLSEPDIPPVVDSRGVSVPASPSARRSPLLAGMRGASSMMDIPGSRDTHRDGAYAGDGESKS